MLRIGCEYRLDLSLQPRTVQRLELVCGVCRQALASEAEDDAACHELTGAVAYAVCPCCRQAAPEPRDRNYRARARRWVAKYR